MKKSPFNPTNKAAEFILAVGLIGFGALGVYLTSNSFADSFYTPPSFIAADCSHDVTLALNNWLASVPNGSTVSFKAGGCYQTDQKVILEGKADITLDGNGATFKRITPTPNELKPPAAHNQHFVFQNNSRLTVRNLTIVGLNTTSDIDPNSSRGKEVYEPTKFGSVFGDKYGECGICLFGNQTATVENVSTDGTYGDGISVGSENGPVNRGITIKDATIDRNGRQGIAVVVGDGVVIDNAKVLHSHATGIDLEANGAKSIVNNVEIRNSYFNSYTIGVSGGSAMGITKLNFHHNTIKSTLRSYPWFNGTGGFNRASIDWHITDNVIEGPSRGIWAYNQTDLYIQNNKAPVVKDENGVKHQNGGDPIIVRDNEFIGAKSVFSSDKTNTALVCNNKLTSTGGFNQPVVCPPSITPTNTPPTTTPSANNSQPASTAANDSSGSNPSTGVSPNAANGSNEINPTSPFSSNTNVTDVVSNPVKTFSSIIAFVNNPVVPLWRKAITVLFVWLIFAGIGLVSFWIWKHKLQLYSRRYQHLTTTGGSSHPEIVTSDFSSSKNTRNLLQRMTKLFKHWGKKG